MRSVKTFDQLIKFIETHDLTISQICEISRKSLKLIVFKENYQSKAELVKALKKYWNKLHDHNERPIFLGLDINVVE